MGTAPYMSPEQLQGKPVDTRSDIFSFGILLYEMVVGRRPFQGETGLELASSILKDAPSSVTDVRDDVPRHLGRIIRTAWRRTRSAGSNRPRTSATSSRSSGRKSTPALSR